MIIVYRCNYCGEDFDCMDECEEHELACSYNPRLHSIAEQLKKQGMSNQEFSELYGLERAKLQRWIESSKPRPEEEVS